MLRALIFFLFLFSFSGLEAPCSQLRACSARLQEHSSTEQFSTENSLKIVEAMKKDKDFQSFLVEISQKKDAVLESTAFQNFVTTLETQQPLQKSQHKNQPGELYIFVSFSLGEKALLNLAQESKRWNVRCTLWTGQKLGLFKLVFVPELC